MALSINVGSFGTRTSVGAQAVVGVGFKPKALIFFTVGSIGVAAFSGNGLGTSVGVATDPSLAGSGVRATAGGSADGVVTAAAHQAASANALRLINSAGTVLGVADLTSMDADGFTLNWTTADVNAYLVAYIAIAGADLTNQAVQTFNLLAAPGVIPVTGVGFKPDLVLFVFASIAQIALPYNTGSARLSIGAMDGAGNQWVAANTVVDGVSPSNAYRIMLTDSCIASPGNTTFLYYKAGFVSMDADGFTLNQTIASGVGNVGFALALKGGSWKVGSTTKPVGGAPAAHAVTGVGFTPKGLFLAGVQSVVFGSVGPHAEIGLGAVSAPGAGLERAVIAVDRDSVNPTISKRYSDAKSFVKVNNATSTVDAAALLTSFDTDGYTLSWNPNDAFATQIGWIAGGDNAAAPTGGGFANTNRWSNRPFLRGGN